MTETPWDSDNKQWMRRPRLDEKHARATAKSKSDRYPALKFFIVYEDGEYITCTETELETYFAGIAQHNIVAAYRAGEEI